ncbi:vacuolar protein sorting-associated protein 54-like isoform X2 [Varroa jacobsoni]|uniref:vacuolar protein sorting-associated protein 54-like isoform X2 n=1 Tax=Varroa jacobsoni TaxID=62625 RepID=UPI000BF7DC28|nr:vacuolar protein sorting-associated protein 54-like isoform X2 [Varroa jacobsoni]
MPKLKCALCTHRVLPGPVDFVAHVRLAHCHRGAGPASGFECHYSSGSQLCAVLKDTAHFEAHVLNVHLACTTPDEPDVAAAAGGATWSVYDCTQNLPALLNDPGRKRGNDFFTKTWGDAFIEPQQVEPCKFLPVVKRASFEDYLERTKTRWQRRARNGQIQKPKEESSTIPAEKRKQKSPKKQPLELTIEQVPSIFFKPNFDLSDPETFTAVLGCAEEVKEVKEKFSPIRERHPKKISVNTNEHLSREGAVTNYNSGSNSNVSSSSALGETGRQAVQERLGQLTDLVEVRLIKHISQHSDAFFDALTSQDELADRMAATLSSITAMRQRIAEIEEQLVKEPLRVLQLHQRRQNILSVVDKLELMLNVHHAQPTIQVLLANCEFVGALDLIDTTNEILNQELKDVVCFRHLGHQLKEIENLILRILETDFKKYTAADLNRELNSGPQIKDLDQLRAVICGLLRLGKGPEMVRWYQEEATTALQAMVKQTQVEFAAEMTHEDIIRPEQQLEHLEISEWMTLLYRAFNNVEKLLLRIRAVYDLCLEILGAGQPTQTPGNDDEKKQHNKSPPHHEEGNGASTAVIEDGGQYLQSKSIMPKIIGLNGYPAGGSFSSLNEEGRIEDNPKMSPSLARMKQLSASRSSIASSRCSEELLSESERGRIEVQLSDMLLEASNAAHDACAKLVSAKSEDGSLDKVGSSDFVALCQGIESFSTKCEKVCKGRRGTGLRLALQSRANRFVTAYHDQHKDTLILVLENEPFKAVKVPQNLQNMLTSAIMCSSGILRMVKCDSRTDSTAIADTLSVNGEHFVVSGCALHLLKLLLEYCQSSLDIPMLAADLLTRLLDLLRHFNTATYRLVLGPATTRSFSGPTISKLLIASRSLELVERLIPYLRGHFERSLAKKQLFMVRHFAQMASDLREHSAQIETRVLSLAAEAVDAKLAEWVLKAPVPSNAFRGITSIVIAVNNSLSSTLPEDRGVELLKKCHQSFLPALRKHLLRLGVKPDGGPQHGMVIQELTFYAEILKRNGVPSIEFDGVWSNLYS